MVATKKFICINFLNRHHEKINLLLYSGAYNCEFNGNGNACPPSCIKYRQYA